MDMQNKKSTMASNDQEYVLVCYRNTFCGLGGVTDRKMVPKVDKCTKVVQMEMQNRRWTMAPSNKEHLM